VNSPTSDISHTLENNMNSYETTHVMHDTQAWAELDADGWVTVEVTDGWSLMTRRWSSAEDYALDHAGRL